MKKTNLDDFSEKEIKLIIDNLKWSVAKQKATPFQDRYVVKSVEQKTLIINKLNQKLTKLNEK